MKICHRSYLHNISRFYFGKIKSRGDFVKSTAGSQVIALIDRWVAQGMEALIESPCWKISYDQAGPTDFLFMGADRKHAIHGTIVPGCDASARRFPFVAATTFAINEPLSLLKFGPVYFYRHATRRKMQAACAVTSADAHDALACLTENDPALKLDADEAKERCRKFIAATTIGGLAALLGLQDADASVRQMVLALRYLLRPLPIASALRPHKAIAFPLPKDHANLPFVESFWLSLISVYVSNTKLEISVFSTAFQGKPKLIVGFNGVTSLSFRALFEEQAARDFLIDLGNSHWVEQDGHHDSASMKLSNYLTHGTLSLQQLLITFGEVART
ncbi:type VI secretion system-associated protein TagF [Noviherbaspirillum saxi]|uniref:Type VI secretion system-associated protein TagF n=1 Tax=Noviherbaspirillum saxi TaxID=2320863 RepID=A0A3A3FKL7_9BURK|nr:type VI secretion system-associated protein TagF [Noviherbaspirillum saxi]RJF95847.1 type VI secretion system-associated protein TagF [Noviherbaspirillum saxi]